MRNKCSVIYFVYRTRAAALLMAAMILAACASPGPAPTALPSPTPLTSAPQGLAPKPNFTPGPNDPQAFFLEPLDGALVVSPVLFRLGVANLKAPAGEFYFHIAVDMPCTAAGQPFPEDSSHVRLDKGAIDTKLNLPAGSHRLCLQLSTDGKTAPAEPGLEQVIDIVAQ